MSTLPVLEAAVAGRRGLEGPDFLALGLEPPEAELFFGAPSLLVFDDDDFFGIPLPLLVLPLVALFAIIFSASLFHWMRGRCWRIDSRDSNVSPSHQMLSQNLHRLFCGVNKRQVSHVVVGNHQLLAQASHRSGPTGSE